MWYQVSYALRERYGVVMKFYKEKSLKATSCSLGNIAKNFILKNSLK